MMGISPIVEILMQDNEPVIVVGFENNKDGYVTLKNRLNYSIKPLEALQEK